MKVLGEKQNQANILSGIKNVVGNAYENFSDFTKIISKNLIGLEKNSKIMRQNQNIDLSEFEDPNFYSNPLLISLISLKNQMEIKFGINSFENMSLTTSIKIKMEICNLLLFFQELRLDYLLTNFIQFFDEIQLKIRQKRNYKKNLQSLLKQEIHSNFLTFIPPIFKTGIEEIDLKNEQNEDGISENRASSFINYCNDEAYDLDTLLGEPGKRMSILPSLLVNFYLTNESQLQNKIMDVIMSCLNQRDIFFKKILELNILFEKNDVILYKIMTNKIKNLKILSEQSEVNY